MPDPVVMRLWGDGRGNPTPHDGEFLADFDFEAHGGVGEIVTTPDPASAKQFPTMAEAFEFYKRSPECKPTRADGKPNRPLTSTNWELLPLSKAQERAA